MQLKDLFKPDQFGNVPLYRDTEGFLLRKSTTLDDTYEYRAKDDILNGLTHYLSDSTEVFETSREDKVLIYISNIEHPVAFYRVYGVPATAENILLARILEKQK